MIQTVHSYWAYGVLILLVVGVVNALMGILQNRAFTHKDFRISLFGLIFTHLQLLIGLILYFVSPKFAWWQEGVGRVMKSSLYRLYLVEHPLTNLIAVLLITMGWSLHKRQSESRKKFVRIGLFYGLGLLLLLSRIPWANWP